MACSRAVAAALGAVLIGGAPLNHRIEKLPGWHSPLPSNAYAGFIPAGNDTQDGTTYEKFEHYMFIESENNPKTDPLVIWTNGGPGASSFFGLMVELGPFMLSDLSLGTKEFNETGIPTLFPNEYSWTKVASILILNSPSPVGYSYCQPAGPSGNGTSCGVWNDTRTAVYNYEFLLNWFKVFPEYQANDLYITGESYAGIYVPTLAREIIQNENKINLKGWAVGDGCLGTDILCGGGPGAWNGPFFHVEFMHGHGQFSDKTYEAIQENCSLQELRMNKEVGAYYNYNLYDDCWYENGFLKAYDPDRSYWGPPFRVGKTEDGGALNDYPCGGNGALTKWIGTPEVKAALHVPQDAFFFSGDNGAGFDYRSSEPNLSEFYKNVAENTNYRVLIYNGDTDPGLNSFIMQNWTRALGLEEAQSWRPWTIDGKSRMGGYVVRYKGDFDTLTIRGSGHMVPEFKPRASLEFLTRWLRNEDWKTYNPSRGSASRRLEVKTEL
ncbi:hypothetical protein AAMO2058_001466800 [Amorphochlora amoebiformis]